MTCHALNGVMHRFDKLALNITEVNMYSYKNIQGFITK